MKNNTVPESKDNGTSEPLSLFRRIAEANFKFMDRMGDIILSRYGDEGGKKSPHKKRDKKNPEKSRE